MQTYNERTVTESGFLIRQRRRGCKEKQNMRNIKLKILEGGNWKDKQYGVNGVSETRFCGWRWITFSAQSSWGGGQNGWKSF